MTKLEPVFPIRDMNEHPGPIGMTLRDYFAAVALQGRNYGVRPYNTTDDVAADCYAMADAMLAERAK